MEALLDTTAHQMVLCSHTSEGPVVGSRLMAPAQALESSLLIGQAVTFVRERLGQGWTPRHICEALCDHCLAPNTAGDGKGCDNMSAMVVLLKPSGARTGMLCSCAGEVMPGGPAFLLIERAGSNVCAHACLFMREWLGRAGRVSWALHHAFCIWSLLLRGV